MAAEGSVHQFKCTKPISQTAGIGADEKLILQGLEVARTFFPHKVIRLNTLFGLFKAH